MKKQFQSKAVPRGTRTIWRYLSALFILFTFAGNVWGTATVYHTFAAAGDTIVDLEGTGSTPSAKFTAVNNTNWAAVSTSAKNNSIYKMDPSTEAVATSKSNTYGTKLGSSAKSTYKVTGVSNVIFYVGTGTAGRIAYLDVTENGKSKVSEAASVTLSDKNNAYKMSYALDASKSYTLEAYASADLFCYAVKFTVAPDCNQPATALSLSSDAPATIYAGTEITFSTSGGNGGDITIEGAASETISANKWTATEGVHTFTASQPKTDGKCAQEAELKLTVVAATPVSTVTVNGPANGYKNNEVIFAATAANATQYRWTVDGVAQGSDSAKLHFTPTEVKTYSIVCEAKNAYNSDWVASTAHSLTVTSLYGELIRATLTGGNNATMTGIVGGAFDSNLGSGKYKLDNDKYMGVQLASGNFQEGDTVMVNMTVAGGNYPCLFADKDRNTLLYLATEGSSALEYKIVLPAAANNKNTVYLSRHDDDYKWNPTVKYISVIRPIPVKSTAYDLTDVKINGTAISAANLATLKTGEAYLLDLTDEYAAAPTIKFARQTTKTFEDDSQKAAIDTITVTASEVSSKWQAKATIGTITYTVKMAKVSAAKVYYYDGSTKLGEETVAINGNPAEYETYQGKVNLASFVDWYNNADLAEEHKIADISALVVTKDTTVYGKWTYTYAQSVNVEKWVLDNGKTPNSTQTAALRSLLGTRGFASNLAYEEGKLELDSLNDSKGTGRNYTYLGLKVKLAGKMLDFRLAKDNTVKVKFGNVGSTPLLAINGGEYANMTIEDGVFAYTATGEDYISIKTASTAAVVFQQIMIGEDIQDVTLPEPTRHAVVLTKAGETEHGTLAVASPETYNWLAEDVAVTLTVAADEGYYIESVTLNGEALTPSENVYSFAMPNATANVVATFAEIVPNNVTYMPNGAEGPEYIVDYDATVVLGCPAQFTAPANTKFDGWNTAPDGSGDAYAEGDPVLSALQLYAQWKEYFVITYKDGDDVLDTEDVFVGEAPVGIADPVKAFNLFLGWTLSGSDEVIDVKDLTASTTVYAKWEAIDACFYYLPTKPAEAVQLAVDAPVPGANGGSMKVLGDKIYNSPYGLSFENSGTAAVLVTLDKNMEAATVIKAKVVVNPKEENARGLLLRNAANSATVQEWTFVPAQNPDTLEFTYTVQAGDGLAGTNQFCIKRSTNAWLISLMVSNCAPEQFTVTYKDGEATLGTEGVYENAHPTANGINTHKKGYEFQGWAETVDGAVVDLDDITITAAKNLFAQYTVMDCSPKGVKFSMAIDGSKISANQYYPNTTPAVGDLAVFATVTGGVAQAVNTSTGTTKNFEVKTTPEFKLGGSNSHMRILLDCPLAENDTIKFTKTERIILSFDSLKTKSENIAKTTSYYIVPAAYAGEDTIHIWYNSNGVSVNGVQVIRPEIYTVSFNMMGHGSAIAPVDVAKGGKITAPTAPEDADFAFGGWYKENTLSNAWDFENDVVSEATTLYAKWLDMSDATLKSLKYGETAIELQAGIYEYNVELPALTAAVPALTAVTSNPNATKEIVDGTFDEAGNAVSTVEVTPEKEGAAHQIYTVNFSKEVALPQVNVTAATTWDWSLAGSTSLENQTNVVLANVPGITNDATFNSQALFGTFNKLPGNYFQGSMLTFTTEVAGRLTITFRGTNNKARHMQVCVGDGEAVVADWAYQGSGSDAQQTKSVIVPAGKVTLKAFEGESTQNVRIYNMALQTPDYTRTVNPNNIGTLCWTNNAVLGFATLYELAGKDANNYLVFDEVEDNIVEAGKPYIFMPEDGNTEIAVFNTDDAEPMTEAQLQPVNYMYGTLAGKTLTQEDDAEMYYFSGRNIWRVADFNVAITIPANCCYVDYPAVLAEEEPAPAPAPGRRRITMGGKGANAATGFESIDASEKPVKLMIDGKIYILRGEKMYDATGRLVK